MHSISWFLRFRVIYAYCVAGGCRCNMQAMKQIIMVVFVLSVIFIPQLSMADREPVLKQIQVPHSYYYREMYLPQLTSGPSSASWSPESNELVFSMAGSLWKQRLDSTTAEQLTAGPGYDYQPDWSSDGKRIVFSRYDKDAVELWLLNLTTGKSSPLTQNGAVNIDARWSPDGSRLAFVSTLHNGRFHIFIGSVKEEKLDQVQLLLEERQTKIYRYYYSPFDHELSPAWSPDGTEIIFVSNRDNIYGSGGFWKTKAESGSQPREIRYEETTWKAHPDWSPDGKRVLYSSYLGRQWNQIWIMTAEGGDPFPLTYGNFDNTAPRWSPDGNKFAFVSNVSGNTALWVQEMLGGKQRVLRQDRRKYMMPMARLQLKIQDATGKDTSARVFVTASDGRFYAPSDSWVHADDAFTRSERAFEAHYFHSSGSSDIEVPAGKVKIEVMKGFEHHLETRDIELKADESRTVQIQLQPFDLPWDRQPWISGDLHVHMNYGGAYRNTPEHLREQANAENLPVIYNLIVNKEQRIPDIAYFSTRPDPVSGPHFLLFHSQEFHTSYWGHLGVLKLGSHYLMPDYSTYGNTGAASPYPSNAVVADLAHEQGALVGYVHPFDSVPDPGDDSVRLTNELPVDVALGKSDYFEVVGFSDHRSTAEVWYRLLNCGFRLPAGAGTDAMANFASLRGPVGLNRVYVLSPGSLTGESWNESLRNGHSFATNGPLIHLRINGKEVGSEIALASPSESLEYQVRMRSIVPVDHLELISNGKVVKAFDLMGDRTSGEFTGTLNLAEGGWVLLRAWNEQATFPVLDIYPYATTSPIYVTVNGRSFRSGEDAAYFVSWIDRITKAAGQHPDYNTDEEKSKILDQFKQARAVYEEISRK